MEQWTGHGPVRRWRTAWLRVWCRCGMEVYPCPALIAQQRYQAALDEARAWRSEARAAFYGIRGE